MLRLLLTFKTFVATSIAAINKFKEVYSLNLIKQVEIREIMRVQ